MLRSIALWLEERLHLVKLFQATGGHKVPPSTNSWFYVFGIHTCLCFHSCRSSPGSALPSSMCLRQVRSWTSLQYLNNQQFLGWFLRAVHNWGSIFMVGIMTLHLVQTFLFGAFKYPRELTWVSGCVLFLCTLGMAFTGQILRFDQDAYWGLGIGASIMGLSPVHRRGVGSPHAGRILHRGRNAIPILLFARIRRARADYPFCSVFTCVSFCEMESTNIPNQDTS